MKTIFSRAHLTDAKKEAAKERRFRNILANSGDIMESNEVRDVENFYVMGRDGKLHRIADLNKDPEKQAESYSVNLATNHGHNDPVTGERVVDIEDIIGDARVWLDENNQLCARVYFANDDAKADHAWAVSDNASYSIGADHYPEGYSGAGNEIDEPVAILREISMVDTGNDPRAVTIDSKLSKVATGDAVGDNKLTKGTTMPGTKKSIDQLTPDERVAMAKEIDDVIDKFTTDVPESETEPTARDNKDNDAKETTDTVETEETGATEPTAARKSDDRVARQDVIVIRERGGRARQERGVSRTTDYLKSERAVAAWGEALLMSKGDAHAWRDNFRKIAKRDGVDFGEDVSIAPFALVKEIEKQLADEDSIFAHVTKTGLAYAMVAIPTKEDGAVGHKNGQKKTEENIKGVTRIFTPADIYKLMKLDHSMVKLNGGISSSAIVKYVLSELPSKLIETIDQAILVGGIKNEDNTDFEALISILSDIQTENSIYGSIYTAQAGDNLRATITKAASRVRSGYNRYLITTPDFLTDVENATTTGGQLLFPNGINKENPGLNGIRRILTPLWLTNELMGGLDAIIVDLPAYKTVGDVTPENFSDYDIDYNKYVWEAVACIGGGLANKNAAVGLKLSAGAAPAAAKASK